MYPPDNLLHAILEQPGDEASLLVFADWLEEQGDADNLARAELVRLQAAWVKRPGGAQAERDLRRQAKQWQTEHGGRLLGPLRRVLGKRVGLLEADGAGLAFLVAAIAAPGEDLVQPESRWHGELNQPPYAFPTVFTITSRRGNAFTGEMSQDFSSVYGSAMSGRFWFTGVVLVQRISFVTNRVEGAGIFPGLYVANLSSKKRTIAGTWRVPRRDMTGTFRLERRKPGRRGE
jgi:uncharacterized protein (TIGR02996 family)